MAYYISEYTDYVMCRKDGGVQIYLFRAPAFSHLEKGDEVYVESEDGEKKMVVMTSITLNNAEEKVIEFIKKSTLTDEPVKKVLKKVEYKVFEYGEDETYERTDQD